MIVIVSIHRSVSLLFLMYYSSNKYCYFHIILALDELQQPAPELQKPLSTDDHFKVSQRLKHLTNEDLIKLGTALGLHYSNVKKMKDLPEEMVHAWLIGADNVFKTASWASLITALRKIDQKKIASAIQTDETSKNDCPLSHHPLTPLSVAMVMHVNFSSFMQEL